MDLPFCSSATVSALNFAFGASAVTTSVPALADRLVGLLDADDRHRFPSGDDEHRTGGNQQQDDQPGKQSHHAYD